MFALLDLITCVVQEDGTELHSDRTLKVVPLYPHCR
ncbi:Uncharacterized protein FWK35_00015771 [Aphis craccivora]|uniref:Uncharacterized protein n=1 Tax=Aphis craccivora TaxID=307492 RepID=A0A6G0Z6D0_APHCR|nr:Uncharacterized protein FWK35_00015771 [Aphis craccivora]